jgi:(p)ppGpp synthase/HD superfamily hydrolase
LTKKALRIAYDAHHGQVDKLGLPYICHPLHLAEHIGDDEKLIAAALLHDVVEDTDVTFEQLAKQGIPDGIITALKLLTRDKSVPYMDYIRRIKDSGNATAAAVKRAYLRHNADARRAVPDDGKAEARLARYKQALALLENE